MLVVGAVFSLMTGNGTSSGRMITAESYEKLLPRVKFGLITVWAALILKEPSLSLDRMYLGGTEMCGSSSRTS